MRVRITTTEKLPVFYLLCNHTAHPFLLPFPTQWISFAHCRSEVSKQALWKAGCSAAGVQGDHLCLVGAGVWRQRSHMLPLDTAGLHPVASWKTRVHCSRCNSCCKSWFAKETAIWRCQLLWAELLGAAPLCCRGQPKWALTSAASLCTINGWKWSFSQAYYSLTPSVFKW